MLMLGDELEGINIGRRRVDMALFVESLNAAGTLTDQISKLIIRHVPIKYESPREFLRLRLAWFWSSFSQ